MESQIFAASIIALVIIVYGFIALRRRARFRTLALELGAIFIDTGRFAPGKVSGNDFSIEAHTLGVGRSRRYYTTIKVSVPKAPGTYLLKTSFFEHYPDWQCAKALGSATERVFIATISFQRYLELSPDQRDALLSWLGRCSFRTGEFHQALKKNRIKELVLSEASIATTFRGIVSNLDRLRGSLNAIRLLAR